MVKALKGTKDILPGESSHWQALEESARSIFRLYGYQEIRTPIIEETALFVKSIGETTDIVSKEMFSFVDRGERNISLRPEGTAPVVRSYIENNLDKTQQFQKLYYIGPMFRAERPQAGRMRQFHQIGVEAIGSSRPSLDAEVIATLVAVLDNAGIHEYSLRINNLGCAEDKERLSTALKVVLASESGGLCDDCKRRLVSNPLRLIDCKNEGCRRIVRGSFEKIQFLCDGCKLHFDAVLTALNAIGIRYALDPYIVRGLDYYTKTVFEVSHGALGAQDAIGAGGRYDGLVSAMGGPAVGACGFALGCERMQIALAKERPELPAASGLSLFIATLGDAANAKGLSIAQTLRRQNIACDIDHEGRSLKAQMGRADKLGCAFTMIIGDDEIAKGEAPLRSMRTKEQRMVKLDETASGLPALLKVDH